MGCWSLLNDNEETPKVVAIATRFRPNSILHDYTGHAPDLRVAPNGSVTLGVPKNDAGLGFVCYSRAGLRGEPSPVGRSVTQEFEGAADLDIKPAEADPVSVGRIWPAVGKKIIARLTGCNTKLWAAVTRLVVELLDPAGQDLATKTFCVKDIPRGTLEVVVNTAGWHEFKIHALNAPASSPRLGYTLAVTYSGPTRLKEP
jgi:alpha-amylase